MKTIIKALALNMVLLAQLSQPSLAAEEDRQETRNRLDQLWAQFRNKPEAAERAVDAWLSNTVSPPSVKTRKELEGMKVLMLCRRVRPVEAGKLSSLLVAADPLDGHSHALYAHALLCAQKYPQALIEATKAVELDGTQSLHHMLLGETLIKLGRRSEAIAAVKTGERVGGDACQRDVDFLTRLGAFYSTAHEPATAEARLRKALAINPQQQNAWEALGELYRLKGERAKAVTCFEKVVSLKGDASLSGQAAFHVQECAGTKKALALIDQALALDPRNASVYTYKALILMRSDQSKEALSCFNRALELDPDNPWILQSRADCLIVEKLGALALTDAQKALALQPCALNSLLCARAQLCLTHYREAIATADAVLKSDPALAEPYIIKAKCRTHLGEYWQAIEDLTMARIADPLSNEPLYLRAATFVTLHQFDAALADVNELIRHDPQSRGAFEMRSEILRRSGHAELAEADKAHVEAMRAQLPDAQP